jgi:hypothetical protein
VGLRVVQVEESGPAGLAGLTVGDQIVAVDGNLVGNPWFKPNLTRIGAGGTQRITVLRGDVEETVQVKWTSLPTGFWQPFLVDYLVTMAFLGFGLWAFLSSGTSGGLLLAVLGLSYGVANFRSPNLGALDTGICFLQQNLSVFYTAVLFHFFLVFPKPKRVAGRPVPWWLIYLPFLPFFVFSLAEWGIYPDYLDEYRTVMSFTDLFFMVAALAGLVHSWITLSGEERRATRFSWILWGFSGAFGPFLALGLLGTVVGEFVIPGREYLPLLAALIPGSMAFAVVIGARSRPMSDLPSEEVVRWGSDSG